MTQEQPNGVQGSMTTNTAEPQALQLALTLDSLTLVEARFIHPSTTSVVHLDRAQWEQQGRPSRLIVTLEQS